MLRNYLTSAWRNFSRHKTFSTINLLGLTIGMAACLLIFQYVRYERSYDQFHENKSDVYRVAQNRYNNGKLSTEWAAGCGAIGKALKDEFPEVKAMSTVRHLGGTMNYGEVYFRENDMYMVMPDFFDIFSLNILEGNPKEKFDEPNQVIISTSTAKKYFGDEDPMGKTIEINKEEGFTVIGIFEDVPETSHMKFDMLFSFQTYIKWVGDRVLTAWNWDGYYTYVQLEAGTNQAAFEEKIPDMVSTHIEEEARGNIEFYLQPITDIHLTSNLMMEMEANGNGQYVRFLSIIAIFILFIAWVNYINLSTAKSTERAREVGIRKVMGSFKALLMRQFLLESFLTNLAAAVIAVGLTFILLPFFNTLTGQELTLSLYREPNFWLAFLGILTLGSLLSGIYPAFVLASFQPVTVLKGRYSSSAKGILLRKMLVGFQFVISLLLIAGTVTVYQQLNFMRDRDLGINIDQTLIIRSPNITDSTYSEKLTALKTELARPNSISVVSSSTAIPGRKPGWNAGGVRKVGAPPSESNQYRVIGVDYSFIDAYELELTAGRKFDESFGTDESTVIFNESAISLMGFADTDEALGSDIFFWGDTFKIVGVLADYHQESLKVNPDPLIFRLIPSSQGYYSVKIQGTGAELQASMDHINETWEAFFAGSPMDYFFLDTFFNEQYKNDRHFGKAFGSFALLAILVACMGLFGLSAYSAIQRTKEVGIRKVMGASVYQIAGLLTREILILIFIAAVIALPLAWFGMNAWLTDYAYRIDLNWTFFVFPVVVLLFITLITVSFQTFKTAFLNPVRALRYE